MDATTQKLLKAALSQLGYSEQGDGYSKFGEWYATHVAHSQVYSTAEWCDMFTAWVANQTGLQADVGQFAYTPYHAQWFVDHDAWGTTPQPGALVFYSWSGSKSIDAVEHVGIVINVLPNGEIHTIEGNTYNGVVGEHVRTTADVVGYGYPAKIAARLAAAQAAAAAKKQPTQVEKAYRGRHAAPAHARTVAATKAATTSPGLVENTAQDAALTGVLAVVLFGTVALAVGKRKVKVAMPSVRLRRRGRHHRLDPEVIEVLESAEAVTQPMLLGVVAATEAMEEFWGELRNLEEDEELAFWSTLHAEAALSPLELEAAEA